MECSLRAPSSPWQLPLPKTTSQPLPDFPAEIRAPVGTTYGVSGFQLQFGSVEIRTPGDEVDLLVAMNPAALSVNIRRVKKGGTVIVNVDSFEQKDLNLAKLNSNPLTDGTLDGFPGGKS